MHKPTGSPGSGSKEPGKFGSGAKTTAGNPHTKGSNPPKVSSKPYNAATPSVKTPRPV